MNDCVFWYMDCCGADDCRCENYISATSEQGQLILSGYEEDAQGALDPIIKKYKEKYLEGNNG